MGESTVLSLCLVRDKVWVGFEIGYILIFDSVSHRLFAQAWIKQYSPVVSIFHIPHLKRVCVVLATGSVISFQDEVTLLPGNNPAKAVLHLVAEYQDSNQNLVCGLAVPIMTLSSIETSHELWISHSNAAITVLDPDDLSIVKVVQNTDDLSPTPSYVAYSVFAHLVCGISDTHAERESSEEQVCRVGEGRREGGREMEKGREVERDGKRKEEKREGEIVLFDFT